MQYLKQSKSSSDLVARLLVEELYRNGVRQYAIAPGARMIPFMRAVADHPKTYFQLFNDERSAAFWAQAYSRSSNVPTALLVTSGTALANLLPGIIEAYYSNVPLIVITSDRPWELQNSGANQTIAQSAIYKDYTKAQISLPAISDRIFPESLLANIDYLATACRGLPAGPVHLNIAFRKPFTETDFAISKLDSSEQELINNWYSSKAVYKHHTDYNVIPSADEISALKELLRRSNSPLIVSGPENTQEANQSVLQFAEKISAPVLADINSGLRASDSKFVCNNYNAYLDNPDLQSEKPDLILYFGGRIVSERLKTYLQQQACQQILFTNKPERQDAIENDYLPISRQVFCNYTQLATSLVYVLEDKKESKLLQSYKRLETDAQSALLSILSSTLSAELSTQEGSKYFEAYSINLITNSLPAGSIVYHSSSLIFRELEFFATAKNNLRYISNRGAVGIDGVLASAIGAQAATQKKTCLLIGDQAFLHDINSLALLKDQDLHVFIINNAGGAVFNILDEDEITDCLINSQDFNFSSLISARDGDYAVVSNPQELQQRLNEVVSKNTPTFTEVITDGKLASEFFRSFAK